MESFSNLKEAKAILQKSGFDVRNYSTYDFGREKDFDTISILCEENKFPTLLSSLRKSCMGNVIIFAGTSQWLGDEKNENKRELVLANGSSQFDILRIARTDAINYDMHTEDLIQKIRELDRCYGIHIYLANTDTVAFTFAKMPADLLSFATEIYKFCPDIVDQGSGTVDQLAAEIDITGRVLLWWD